MPCTVIPTGVFDTSGNEKDSIVLTGWVLDQVLDANKVESAYLKLVQTWPILSARLRTRDKKWVYEIPETFSKSTPQYVFKTKVIQGPIRATYSYPKVSDTIRCTIKENPDQLYSQDGPRSVGDYMKQDIPVAQLQLTTFDDGSLLGLTTPHVLCDGHGNKEIIHALTRILRGEDVPPIQLGDPFEKFITEEPLEAPPYWRVFSTWQTVTIITRLLWDFMRTRDISNRDVFFPKSEVERIKAEAMADLQKEHGENPDIWVSSSDVLVAFCLKCIHPPTTSSKPLNVMYAANLRRYLSEALPKPFLHNGACTIVTPTLPISQISSMSLGALALHIRKTVQTQTEKNAIEHWLKWRIANGGRMTLFFDPRGAWNVVTNWRDMKLMYIDFSAALPDSALADQKKVNCLYLWGNSYQPFPVRNIMGLVADDPSGGIWMGGFFSDRVWTRPDGFGRFIKD